MTFNNKGAIFLCFLALATWVVGQGQKQKIDCDGFRSKRLKNLMPKNSKANATANATLSVVANVTVANITAGQDVETPVAPGATNETEPQTALQNTTSDAKGPARRLSQDFFSDEEEPESRELRRGGFGGFRGFRGGGRSSWGRSSRSSSWGSGRRSSYGRYGYYGFGGSYGIIIIGGGNYYYGHPVGTTYYYGHSYAGSSRACDPTDFECICSYQYSQGSSIFMIVFTCTCLFCCIAICVSSIFGCGRQHGRDNSSSG